MLKAMAAETSSDQRPVIQASEILAKIERGEDVEYDGVIVEGDLDISGLELPTVRVERTGDEKRIGLSEERKVISSLIAITNSEIRGTVNSNVAHFQKTFIFVGAKIRGNAYFYRVEFSENADFGEAIFCGEADFVNAEFDENARFCKAWFGRSADFGKSEFNNNVNFRETKFGGYLEFQGYSGFEEEDLDISIANFGKTYFGGNADFAKAEFNGKTVFRNAKICGNADFSNGMFSEYADFAEIEFFENAHFNDSIFLMSADFMKAQFVGSADFVRADFGENAYYVDDKFSVNAEFHDTKFAKNANYMNAKFRVNSDFSRAEFALYANFDGAKFIGHANFRGAKFGGHANFREAGFGDHAYFREAEFSSEAYFDYDHFHRELSFKDAKFSNHRSQELSCRIAKRKMEDLGNKKEADHYFYREMEAIRIQNGIRGIGHDIYHPPNNFLERLHQFKFKIVQMPSKLKRFLIYDVLEYIFIQQIFGYGVRPFNIAKAWITLVFVLGFIYWIGVGVEKAGNTLEWYEYFYFSIVTAATPGYAGYSPATGFYTLIAGAQAIIGTFMWAAFIATFARKWQR